MKSKTIIISALPESKSKGGRGILTLTQDDRILKCKLRLYNVSKLDRHCKIGIYHNDEVYTANLIERPGYYESSLIGDFDMNSDFYTAIIDTQKGNNVILAGGTYAGYYFDDTSVFSNASEKASNTSTEKIEDTQDALCEEDCDKCTKCEYKKYFYENQNIQLETIEKVNSDENTSTDKDQSISPKDNIQPKEEPSLLESIIPQFDYIFANYPADDELNHLLNNARFVKFNDSRDQYSIGAIYEDSEIKYICYALRSNYNTPAPEELGKYYQWLPLDSEDPLSDGYYIVYQDAHDLKIIEV